MPPYPGLRHSVELKEQNISDNRTLSDLDDSISDDEGKSASDPDDWAAQYQAYLIERETKLDEVNCSDTNSVEAENDPASEELEEGDWAVQYAKYCIEKEKDFFDAVRNGRDKSF